MLTLQPSLCTALDVPLSEMWAPDSPVLGPGLHFLSHNLLLVHAGFGGWMVF